MIFNSLRQSSIFFFTFIACVLVAPSSHADERERAAIPAIIMLLLEDQRERIDLAEASRFLTQATYGPTLDEITALTNSSYEAWIDRQLTLPATSHIQRGIDLGYFREGIFTLEGATQRTRISVWANLAIEAPDQLRQRMAFALSQIFVISDRAENRHATVTLYYDLLVNNAFGTYRDLLEKVTLNQDMGSFLGMAGNQKANLELNVLRPDENYAREIMQLFSIGLFELELDGTFKLDAQGQRIPTYTQATVEELAKALTGWHFDFISGVTFQQNRETQYYDDFPMRAFPDYHDTTLKNFLSVPGFSGVIPPNRSPEQELQQVLDILANHPNTAPFISKQLIQRFVTSNPSPAYVRRIATVFNQTGGSFQAVIKAILLDTEARQGHLDSPATFGKIREPILKLTALCTRATLLEQFPLNAQSVFNFFRPDFSPSGVLAENGLVSPEAQLLTVANIVNMGSAFTDFSLLSNEGRKTPGSDAFIATDHLEELVPDNLMRPEQLIDHLDIILLAGTMPEEMRNMLLNLHSGANAYVATNKLTVVNDILYLVTLSPYFNVQR